MTTATTERGNTETPISNDYRDRLDAGREMSITMMTDKRVERLQTIAAVADRMAEAKGQDRPIWRWIGAEAHAAAEDLRELDRLHRAIANTEEGLEAAP